MIIGAGGHGKVVADIALKCGLWKTIEFLDDSEAVLSCLGLPVVGKTQDYKKHLNDCDFFVAVGNNQVREFLINMLEADGAEVVCLVHPNAVVGKEVVLGKGTVAMAGCVINSSTEIGKGCIINTSASVDHDNRIEDFVHLSPGVHLAGNVKVGKGCWLGIGSTVINDISLCEGCIVGAGAVVIRDITQPGSYVGVPAKKLDKK